ncbi:helix-turn-helix transcriptional regulator [Actinomadura graeca]|uniref:Helix-turn-helix transcriptional regulator n=1 Tax=Actinomadura graeca TaxID=2750812 RepID=A0ABX8QPW6_9ACTN|nr:helix-turn-helix transcriptional regulator [Actinomadura graeca]QXJ20655.1 helix-turn-helix transcriptional regulator [Actinomadura graeca]
MTADDIPLWSRRLRAAREAKGWDIPETGDLLWRELGKSTRRDSARRMVDNWERGRHKPSGRNLRAICQLLNLDPRDLFDGEDGPARTPPEDDAAQLLITLKADALDLATWAERTNVGDTTINYLASATRRLAQEYLSRPPAPLLAEAAELYRRVADLLRGGRQHLQQTRDLHVIAGQLLAFLSWASSDLGEADAAEAYATAGWVMAEQADHDALRAMLLTAQSKNAFWEGRYRLAAELAQRGQRYAPATEARVLLACQEGDARQALGELASAQEAQRAAAAARDAITAEVEVGGLWACGRARQANYAVGVCLAGRDTAGALAGVAEAREAYAAGELWAYGTWAQLCLGAGIAYILQGDLDDALGELAPILALPEEQRLATLASRFGEVDQHLAHRRFSGSRAVLELREQITEYRAGALTAKAIMKGDQ